MDYRAAMMEVVKRADTQHVKYLYRFARGMLGDEYMDKLNPQPVADFEQENLVIEKTGEEVDNGKIDIP